MEYINSKEKKLEKKFLEQGYLIFDIENKKSLKKIKFFFDKYVYKKFKNHKNINDANRLDNFHKLIKQKDLNNFRLDILNEFNSNKIMKRTYYEISKDILNLIVGNELVMQNKINLSIQLPNDESSLLSVHSDIWSGDSPFEVVIWLPLVNCYKSKSMFILPPQKYKKIHNNFKKFSGKSSDEFFKKIKKNLKWIDIKFGQILIFNQALPHGNILNAEAETRWSMNCRFKSIYSPYGDKKIGEFFSPITLKPASKIGMQYYLPKIK